jgi:hypothetical protein
LGYGCEKEAEASLARPLRYFACTKRTRHS